MKKAISDEIQEKLDFLKLDLNKIPKFIKNATIPSFSTSKLNKDNQIKVYKYVPINEIEILLTPHLRSDEIKKKYSDAVLLNKCLVADGTEEEKSMFKVFSQILKKTSENDIKKIDKMQEEFSENMPFKIKYNRDHLWQVYYSEKSNKYFMLVCTKENTFSEFLYLLKKQIKFAKSKETDVPYVYIPINYVGYSETILKQSEISDMENYLWNLTKNWPLIFETYDEDNKVELNIVGETYVYKNIKSNYKITFDNPEDASKCYKLYKALCIMQTEIKNQYKFETKIDENSRLCMYLAKVEITYNSLAYFVKNEFALADYEIVNKNKEIINKEKKLSDLRVKVKEKEDEYLQKQKEISTYLECKKTFFGKMKYFFKNDKKLNLKSKNQGIDNIEANENRGISTKPLKSSIENKTYYTIEDLVVIYSLYEKCLKKSKELDQDIEAVQLKLENINSKVRNANLYIEEIDKHKRSIFDFWKFANKDEKLSLEEGNGQNSKNSKNDLKKTFNYDEDFENLGEMADNLQRKKLSVEELDSIFISQTELLQLINMVCSEKISKTKIKVALENLKNEFNEDKIVVAEDFFDIFGNVEDNNGKVKYIGSKSHREIEKNKFKIMNVNKKIDIFDFTERIQSIANYLGGAFPKISSIYDMNLYKIRKVSSTSTDNRFETYNINVENELEKCKDSDKMAYNLICLNYKEKMPLIYYTNSVFYENTNKTLPLGMDISTNVLIDNRKVKFELIDKTSFKTNYYFSDENNDCVVKDINVYEYDVYLKEKNDEKNYEKDEKNYDENDIENDAENYDEKEELNSYFENEVMFQTDDEILEQTNEESLFEMRQERNFEIDEEPLVKKSKKLLKIEKQYEKEMEKQEKREEKARRKLERRDI